MTRTHNSLKICVKEIEIEEEEKIKTRKKPKDRRERERKNIQNLRKAEKSTHTHTIRKSTQCLLYRHIAISSANICGDKMNILYTYICISRYRYTYDVRIY